MPQRRENPLAAAINRDVDLGECLDGIVNLGDRQLVAGRYSCLAALGPRRRLRRLLPMHADGSGWWPDIFTAGDIARWRSL
jgi:hypothetical protein